MALRIIYHHLYTLPGRVIQVKLQVYISCFLLYTTELWKIHISKSDATPYAGGYIFPRLPWRFQVSAICLLTLRHHRNQPTPWAVSRFAKLRVFFRAIFGVFPKIGGGVVTKMDGLLVISGKTFIKMGWGLGGTIIFRKHYHMLLNWISWEG